MNKKDIDIITNIKFKNGAYSLLFYLWNRLKLAEGQLYYLYFCSKNSLLLDFRLKEKLYKIVFFVKYF